jgi:hypothetical protein
VQWNGIAFGEVVSISVDGVSSDFVEVTPRTSTSRYRVFSPADIDSGTVTLTLRGTAGMQSSNVGLTAALSIAGPGVSWSFPVALFQTLGWQATVGELQSYSVTFKVGV